MTDALLIALLIIAIIHSEQLTNTRDRMETAIEKLRRQVAANTGVIQSAVTLIQGIAARIEAAKTDPAELEALANDLAANDQALADAVAANTEVSGSATTGTEG